MTSPNYQRFTEVLDFKYVGGVARKSPIRVPIPDSGHWHLVVDMEGHHGLAGRRSRSSPLRPDKRALDQR